MRELTPLEKDQHNYSIIYNRYRRLMEDQVPSEPRVFNIRIDLAFSMRNWIKENPDDPQQSTYVKFLRLNESWFAYEALLNFADKEKFTNSSATKAERILKSLQVKSKIPETLDEYRKQIEDEMREDETAKKLRDYILYLTSHPKTGKIQKKILGNYREKINNEKANSLTFEESIALIYAMRNSYVHNGETAKAGTDSYYVKKMILQISYEFILRSLFRIGSYILEFMCNMVN